MKHFWESDRYAESHEDFLALLSRYFERRAYLGNLHCEFSCDENCVRPGCRNRDMQVPVTVFDLIGAAWHNEQSVQELYRSSCYVGLVPAAGRDWLASVSVKLKKPCAHLQLERCRVYPIRPLPCILFPEGYLVDGERETLLSQECFKEYRCLVRDHRVSKQRASAIWKLRWMLQAELLVSDLYLFGNRPFWIDFSSLQGKLPQEVQAHGIASGESEMKSGQPVIFELLECALDEIVSTCPPLNDVEERILKLDDPTIQCRLFSGLADRRRLKRLLQKLADRPPVFELVNGEMRCKRKNLSDSWHAGVW